MKVPLLIATFIVLSLFITCGSALTVKSEPQKEVVDTRILNSIGQSKAETSTPVVKIAEGVNVHETFRYEKSSGDPIQIQKVVLPGNKKKYSKDDILRICIEIKGCTDINGIKIQEFISDDQTIINTSNYCHRIETLKSLQDYRDNLFASEQRDLDANHDGDIKIFRHAGMNSLYWENLTSGYMTESENEKIARFFENILGLAPLNGINITIEDECTVILHSNKYNFSVRVFEENNTAILKYNNFVYYLFVEREPIQKIEIDNRTGKMINKNYKGNLIINDLDNMFEMYIPSLNAKERLVFWYCIKPKRESLLNTITTARIYDNRYQDFPDVDYPLDIEIDRPKCEVTATFNRYKLTKQEKLKIRYNIYSEDLLTNSIIPMHVKLDDTSGNFEIFDLNKINRRFDNKLIDINLTKDNVANVSYLIKFNDSGTFSLPGIWIDGKLYPFDKEVTVMTRVDSTLGWATLLLAFLSIVLGQIFSVDIRKFLRDKKFDRTILLFILISVILIILAYVAYVIGLW